MEIFNLLKTEIESMMIELGEPKYRGRQVFNWIYKGAGSFDEMRNIPADLRGKLSKAFDIGYLDVLRVQESKSDGTRKFLFGLNDGNAIESVFMKYKYGNSICVSSQAGCRMGCKFCASGINGLTRNLTSGEMVAQILTAEKHIRESLEERSVESQNDAEDIERESDWKINHVVIMGTGEPFDNYDNLTRFINIVHDPEGLNLSLRNITVSTSGIIPGIEKISEDFPQVNLAISLHATTDEIRSSMMPINNSYPIGELIEAARKYTEKTHRRITFEYTMVNGVNDGDEDADRLAALLKGMLCHVNIIPLNKVDGTGFDTVSRKRAEEFAALLENNNIPVTVRRELGADIDAACGQLRLSRKQEL